MEEKRLELGKNKSQLIIKSYDDLKTNIVDIHKQYKPSHVVFLMTNSDQSNIKDTLPICTFCLENEISMINIADFDVDQIQSLKEHDFSIFLCQLIQIYTILESKENISLIVFSQNIESQSFCYLLLRAFLFHEQHAEQVVQEHSNLNVGVISQATIEKLEKIIVPQLFEENEKLNVKGIKDDEKVKHHHHHGDHHRHKKEHKRGIDVKNEEQNKLGEEQKHHEGHRDHHHKHGGEGGDRHHKHHGEGEGHHHKHHGEGGDHHHNKNKFRDHHGGGGDDHHNKFKHKDHEEGNEDREGKKEFIYDQIEQINWIDVCEGSKLGIWHRPTPEHIEEMHKKFKLKIIVTIQFEQIPVVVKIKETCEALGIQWVNISLKKANIQIFEQCRKMIAEKLASVIFQMKKQPIYVFLHCYYGLHRTGTMAYCLLRALGYPPKQSMQILKQLREVTYNEVGEQRIETGQRHIYPEIQLILQNAVQL